MNKLLTLSLTIIFASLFFQSCSNEEQDLPEGESPNVPDKDSSIDFDGKTYCTWIKDASYYIGIYNTETKDKIAEIPTVIEGGLNQTANMHYGLSALYTKLDRFLSRPHIVDFGLHRLQQYIQE